jgi:tetratricopeptide (TPR) repeat protein
LKALSAHTRIRRQQLLRQAEGYLELGMPAHAIEVLDRWEPQDIPSSRAAYLRGEALRELKRYAEAVVSLNLAAEGLPDEIAIYVALGWCFKRLGRIDLAIEALERGLAADSSAAILPYNLACYWSLAGNKRQALLLLSQAISLDAEYRNLVDSEPDFDTIRTDPAFQALASVIV